MLDRSAIERLIPHREPFLFLDSIAPGALPRSAPGASADPIDELSASWMVPEQASFFRGHYPGNPVTPGVILCEHVFQAAAVLLALRAVSFDPRDGVPVLARIEKAKFRCMVRPGERLSTRVTLAETAGPAFFLQGRSRVNGDVALELRFALTHAQGPEK